MNFELVKTEFVRMMNDEINFVGFFNNTKSEFSKERLGLLLQYYHYKTGRLVNGLGEYKDFDGDEKTEIKNIHIELLNRTYDIITNPCIYQSPNSPNRHLCRKDCENCTSKKHWLGIIDNKPNHFVDEENNVYFITSTKKGGFGGRVYNIKLETGEEIRCGLWSNGNCTDEIANQIPKGEII